MCLQSCRQQHVLRAVSAAAYPTAAGSHRLRYIPGSYKAWNPNDELEDMTPQELATQEQTQGVHSLDAVHLSSAASVQVTV